MGLSMLHRDAWFIFPMSVHSRPPDSSIGGTGCLKMVSACGGSSAAITCLTTSGGTSCINVVSTKAGGEAPRRRHGVVAHRPALRWVVIARQSRTVRESPVRPARSSPSSIVYLTRYSPRLARQWPSNGLRSGAPTRARLLRQGAADELVAGPGDGLQQSLLQLP
jgi:hypothetical protein